LWKMTPKHTLDVPSKLKNDPRKFQPRRVPQKRTLGRGLKWVKKRKNPKDCQKGQAQQNKSEPRPKQRWQKKRPWGKSPPTAGGWRKLTMKKPENTPEKGR